MIMFFKINLTFSTELILLIIFMATFTNSYSFSFIILIVNNDFFNFINVEHPCNESGRIVSTWLSILQCQKL